MGPRKRMAVWWPWLFVLLCGVVGCEGAGSALTSPDAGPNNGKADDPTAVGDGGEGDWDGGAVDGAVPEAEPCFATDPRTGVTTLSVLPDDGEAAYVDLLSGATTSIRVFAYLMGQGGVLDTLKRKAAEGVSVKVILDGGHTANPKYEKEMTAAGISVAWSDPKFSYMHAKVMVVDDRDALVTTGNYSYEFSVKTERNYVVRITDRFDVADLVTLFDADWSRESPDLACTRLLVSPINARERLLAFVNSADATLEIESMQFADKGIRNAVAGRKASGVDVRVILADPTWIDANLAAAQFLSDHHIPVRYLTAPRVHAKAMVADGAEAYAGSINLSQTSFTRNREVGMVLTDAPSVSRFHDTFEADWAAATPFTN